jgi:asparagine synthase (glutamine-hydrolysing)
MVREGYSLVYNGELYNYRQLRRQLNQRGYNFETDSDTEVFLNGFREWNYELFDRVRGMFAAVIWDPDANETVLVRDHVGQKPLFYYQNDNQFTAGSEIQGVLNSSDQIERRVDPASLSWYLSLGYVPSPRTGFFNVKKLPPAHYMIVKNNAIKRQVRYWDPTTLSQSTRVPENPKQTVRNTLKKAVERRMVSDVPIGAFLSGGLDSSIVVALMSELGESRVSTISVGFEEDAYDERSHARTVADHFDTDHHSFSVSQSLDEILPSLVRHLGEPFADSSAVPSYYLANKTSDVVKVALSGDGGDETFGGYRRYRAMRYLSYLKGILPGTILRSLQSMGSLIPGRADRRSRFGELRRIIGFLGENSVKQYNEMVGLGYDDLKQRLAQGHLTSHAERGGEQWLTRWFKRFEHVEDPAQQTMLVDLMSYLPGDLQVKTDITTMMNSLECRSPFLDRDVLELSFNLPENLKIDGTDQKSILKKAFGDRLPQQILNRSKQGFGVPLAQWFRDDPQASYLRTVLMDGGGAISSVIDSDRVKRLLERHRDGETDAGPLLWAIVMLYLWADEYDVVV